MIMSPDVSRSFTEISEWKPFITLCVPKSPRTPSATPSTETAAKNDIPLPVGKSCLSAM